MYVVTSALGKQNQTDQGSKAAWDVEQDPVSKINNTNLLPSYSIGIEDLFSL